jgi:hypothetical protein
MNKIILSGIGLLLIGVIALILTYGETRKEVITPLSISMPLNQGATLNQIVFIPSNNIYAFLIVFKPEGQFEGKNNIDFLNKNRTQEIQCDIYLRLFNKDETIFEGNISYLVPSSLSLEGDLRYRLPKVHIDKAGIYILEAQNNLDLSNLNVADPKLEVWINSASQVNLLIIRDISTFLSILSCLAGVILLLIGMKRKKDREVERALADRGLSVTQPNGVITG